MGVSNGVRMTKGDAVERRLDREFLDLTEALGAVRAAWREGDVEGARRRLAQAWRLWPGQSSLSEWALLLHPGWESPCVARTVCLRPVEAGDADCLQRWLGDAQFMARFHPMAQGSLSRVAIERAARIGARGMALQRTQHWLALRPGGRPVALLSLVDLVLAHRRAELLAGIPAEADRAGPVGLAALLCLLDVCFNRVGLHKLSAMVLVDNAASRRSLEALGFECEGRRREHFRDPASGRFVDCLDFGLTRTRFRQLEPLARLSRRWLGRDIVKPTPP